MPSQDEYLDELLNGMNEFQSVSKSDEKIDFTDAEIKEFAEPGGSIGVNDTIRLSGEDIERLLAESEESVQNTMSADGQADGKDLMDLLGQEENGNLKEIQELLQKSDNNEAVSDDIVALLQDTSDDEINLWDEMNDAADKESLAVEEKLQRKAERQREKEARKAEKNALKEAKKAARLEAKAAKEAAKKAKKDADKNALTEAEVTQEDSVKFSEMQESSGGEVEQIFDNMDLSGLASFFTDADTADVSEESAADLVEKMVETKQPKKKVFSRILDFLTEEVEEEDTVKNNEDIQLSDENKTIIEQLDKEKKKKGKKSKDKKQEKAPKEKKPKKEKKPPKDKKAKDNEEDNTYRRGSRLSFKQVFPMVVRSLFLVIAIVLVANIAADYSAKKAAKEAYYNGDYEICYQNLFGKDLNESEQIMYSKSECILRIRLWIREYEMLSEEGAEAEALDSLIQSVKDYSTLYEYAVQWNAGPDVEEGYAQILGILSDKYHLTEEQAIEIGDTRSDIEYSKKIYMIADGGAFGSWEERTTEESKQPEILEDYLQEEADLGNISFIDNN